jgi:hypothetical protein
MDNSNMSIILFHFFLFSFPLVTAFLTPGLFFPIKLKEEKKETRDHIPKKLKVEKWTSKG